LCGLVLFLGHACATLVAMACLFCDFVNNPQFLKDALFHDEHTLAFRDIRPMAPMHVLVIPKIHVGGVRMLDEAHVTAMGRVMLTARRVADMLGFSESGFRLVVNDGADAGQSVHHLHVHVLGGRQLGWPPG
jgi:histidine triad (HIT) family protein